MSSRLPLRKGSTLPPLMRLRFFSSVDIGGFGGHRQQQRQGGDQVTSNFTPGSTNPADLNNNGNLDFDYNSERYEKDNWRNYDMGQQNPREPIPNRPLRGEKPTYKSEQRIRGNHGLRNVGGWGYDKSVAAGHTISQESKPVGQGRNRTGRQIPGGSNDLFGFDEFGDGDEENVKEQYSQSRPQSSPSLGDMQGNDFLQKFKLVFDKVEEHSPEAANSSVSEQEDMKAAAESPSPPPDAEEIFKKMKETGLIPNAVAMLDGLCKDGLVQEAMKLFGLMREKGSLPEVVIYTAVVEGFCKAQKLNDAVRIFRKMQNNGVTPNAFSYTVLIQGLYKDKKLEDALNFCVEMLEAGHSPNLATFVGLLDGFCQEKGVEEARSIIDILSQKGFAFDEKAVREYLEKKRPFLSQVWQVILGKTSKQSLF